MRRFFGADEAWLKSMLLKETKAAGFGLHVFTILGNESLREQASMFSKLGAVIGIHGANLANSVFMRPESGIVEIIPNGGASPCYIAGLNSGLAY